MADEATATEEKKEPAGPYYAWNNFVTKRDEWGRITEKFDVGDEIDAEKLGISDEEFEGLIELGAIREEEYPDIPRDISPAEYERAQQALEAKTEELRLEYTIPRTAVVDEGLESGETTETGAPDADTGTEPSKETTPKPASKPATKPAGS